MGILCRVGCYKSSCLTRRTDVSFSDISVIGFAAYCLLIGIEPLRLVRLMGHGSKLMVFEVYGNYLEGIEEDYLDILEYFGRDFVEVKRTPVSSYKNLHCESLVKARGEESVTT